MFRAGDPHTRNDQLRAQVAALPPIFDEFGVDVVFNGHDRQFEISQQAFRGGGADVWPSTPDRAGV